jgi:hypothetical protein
LNDDIVDFEYFSRAMEIVTTMLESFEVGDFRIVRVLVFGGGCRLM